MNIGILGTGSYVPSNVLTNNDLAKMVDTSDEWIKTRTGISERRISLNETNTDLASKAALKAIEAANVLPEDIDLIIVATLTPDTFTPSTACNVQKRIGAVNAACFDISAACSGFGYALMTATQFIKSGTYKKVLVVGSEVLSKVVDWSDRSTCVLFGDGAGAAVVGYKEGADVLAVYSGADGSKGDLLTCPALNDKDDKSYIKMDGREVYKFATRIVNQCINKLLDKSKLTLESIDHFVLHQANSRIMDTIIKKLKADDSKFYKNLHKYGNTSSASIPIVLDEMVRGNMIKDGQKVLLVGFGGGLTWSSLLLKW